MTTETDDKALQAAITELATRKDPYEFEEVLRGAGEFVARFGTFGDLFEEPGLTSAQFSGGQGTAWYMLGHWSVERNDPRPQPPAEFGDHTATCQVCDYLEDVAGLRAVFEHENCHECGLGLDAHDIGRDQFGKPHAWCRTVWQRCEPLVSPGGDAAEHQISDAYDTRWYAKLTDGTYALVTRTYYIARLDRRTFVECQNEYLICRDFADPGGTEYGSELVYQEVASSDPSSEDPRLLAAQASAPEPGEWRTHGPRWSPSLLAAAR